MSPLLANNSLYHHPLIHVCHSKKYRGGLIPKKETRWTALYTLMYLDAVEIQKAERLGGYNLCGDGFAGVCIMVVMQ